MPRPLPLLCAASAAALVLTACAPSDEGGAGSGAALTVGTAMYPLQFVAQRIGGENVEVVPLIAAGVEPHGAEISPAVTRSMQSMDTVLYLSDFAAPVDDAIEVTGVRALDAHHILDEHGEAVAEHEEESHAEEEQHDGHDHGALDPHFWLDPTLLAEYAQDVVAELSELDPDNATAYQERAAELQADLDETDANYADGLAQCERREIFVSHEAYGYLGLRYDLVQEGLAGLDPEAEPSPARVREIRDMLVDTDATTIYTETKVSADVAQALSEDVGVTTAVLEPIETVADGDDYLTVMTRNLEALRTGLDCA